MDLFAVDVDYAVRMLLRQGRVLLAYLLITLFVPAMLDITALAFHAIYVLKDIFLLQACKESID